MAYTNIKKSSDYFNTKLYTGTGSELAITEVGFQPDLSWLKRRNGIGSHRLFDAVRGATKAIFADATLAESTDAESLKSFDSDGFTLGTAGATNGSGNTYANWNWKANGTGSANTDGSISSTVSANTTSGFNIVSYTGNGTVGATVGHGLGTTPAMIIIKCRDFGHNWITWHQKLSNLATKNLELNTTTAEVTDTTTWNNTAPSSSVVTFGSNTTNQSGLNYIMYCWSEKQGYSKFGSYTGNGNADGTFVYTGFKPAFVLVKNTQQGADDWFIWDNKRPGYNQTQKYLSPNSSNAEADSSSYAIDTLSNGFKVRASTGAINNNNETMIYMTFAEQPLVGDNPATAR